MTLLERQLEASIDYERERWLQTHCVPSAELAAQEAWRLRVHADVAVLCARRLPQPIIISGASWQTR